MHKCKEQAIILVHVQKSVFSWYYVQKIHGSTSFVNYLCMHNQCIELKSLFKKEN